VQPAIPPILVHGDLELDTGRRRASHRRPLELGPKEFGVLELLLAAQEDSSR
jgi:DNA-binding response OmpR family regulator